MKFFALDADFHDEISPHTMAKHGTVTVAPLSQSLPSASGPVVYVEAQLEPADVVEQVIHKKCNFLLQKNKGYFENDLVATAGLAEQRTSYFAEDFQFSPEPALQRFKMNFSTPQDKELLKEKSLALVADFKSGTLEDSLIAIIEELYMNALFDAPREATRVGKNPAPMPRLELILTEKFLQVSCTDFYGSLDIFKFLQRMNDVYRNGAGPVMNMDTNHGAGLGCVILFEHSSCVILGVDPGRQSKVSCLIPIGINHLRRSQMKKSLHWFQG